MLSFVFLAFVLAGTSYAAYLDLKTSEVPDVVSLLVGGGSILFYLYRSLSLPLTVAEGYLIGGTVLFAGAVATYLKLYRLLDEKMGYTVADWLDERTVMSIDRGDVVGTLLLGATAMVYYTAFTAVNVQPVIQSVLAGTLMFALGWGMYLAGMWGGADAFVLGAVGYAFPYIPAGISPTYASVLPTPVSLLILVFSVGAVYSVVYAVYVAFRDGDAVTTFWQGLVDQRRRIAVLAGGYMVAAVVLGQAVHMGYGTSRALVMQNAVAFLVVLLAMLVLYQFLKVVEDQVMRQQIPVEELQPGDVLADDLEKVQDYVEAGKIVGVTAEQIVHIQEHYETVKVRTGVRFIVAFPIAILILVLYGDPLYALAGILGP